MGYFKKTKGNESFPSRKQKKKRERRNEKEWSKIIVNVGCALYHLTIKWSRTMGSCLTKIEPPECKHERLNEHNDRYFDKVHARNSVEPKRRWWKGRQESLEVWKVPNPTTPSNSSEPEEVVTHILSEPSSFATNFRSSSESPSLLLSPPPEKRRRRHSRAEGKVDGWMVKRKGNALQLRLAKNRFLQIAASSPAMSPITMSSTGKSPSSASKTFDPLSTSLLDIGEDLMSEFESSMSNGMIWVEIAHSAQVTALNMSRPVNTGSRINSGVMNGSFQHSPLLLAVGDEKGMVTVTEILAGQDGLGDKQISLSGPPPEVKKFGETLEFPSAGKVRSLDFSPDGKHLVVGGDGCTACILQIILDPDTKKLLDLRPLQQVERVDRIYAVQFSPDSSTLAVGGFDGKVAFISLHSLLETKLSTRVEVSRPGLIYCLDWSPNGDLLALGGSDKCCTIVDESQTIVQEVFRSAAINTVKWNHNGTYLAIGDKEVTILEGDTFDIKWEISNTPTSPDSRYKICSLCWSPDGRFLAVGGTDGCLVVEAKGFALVHEVRRVGSVLCLAWGQQVLKNGDCRRFLAVGDESRHVALLKAGTDIDGTRSESDDLSSSASSSHFSCGSDWVLREESFQDADTALPLLPQGIMPQGNITCVAFSKSHKSKASTYLAYAAEDCSLAIMTTRDWKVVFVSYTYPRRLCSTQDYNSVLTKQISLNFQQMEFAKPIHTLMFSSSSQYLALGGLEGVLYVLSVPSRSMISNTIFSSSINSVAFSRHDERLSIGCSDGNVAFLSTEKDWTQTGEIDNNESPVMTQDWTSKNFAVGRQDGSVSIFETEKILGGFIVPTSEFTNSLPVHSVSFGASGRFLGTYTRAAIHSIFPPYVSFDYDVSACISSNHKKRYFEKKMLLSILFLFLTGMQL